MIERVSGVSPAAFPPDDAALARELNKEVRSFVDQLRSPNIDIQKLAATIVALDKLSKRAEQC